MPNIIGPFASVKTSMTRLEAHLTHLSHLSNDKAASRVLNERFSMVKNQANEIGRLMCEYIAQGIEFHRQSVTAPNSVRPVMQYYSYLNLAVACILAYQPTNYNQYKHHGIKDKSDTLTRLELSSILVQMRRGAIPLFHNIISDENLYNQKFRLNELVAAIPLVESEITNVFGMKSQSIIVNDRVENFNGKWVSKVQFKCQDCLMKEIPITPYKLERALPVLRSEYLKEKSSDRTLNYRSKTEWSSEVEARNWHQKKCIKMINFGGHLFEEGPPLQSNMECKYFWWGVEKKRLLPTLTSTLLLSFGLASIARYRPALRKHIEDSVFNMLINVFIHESDGMMIPAFRNMLFREELCVLSVTGL